MKHGRRIFTVLALCVAAVWLLTAAAWADDDDVMAWEDLQAAFSAGDAVTLTNDVTAGAGSAALTVPRGKSVTLDLGGFTLSRGLSSSQDNGSVIIVNGTLTVVDGSSGQTGVITGGSTNGVGGGVWVKKNGSFTMNAGTISGNSAQSTGGGVYVSGTGSSFTMCGGTITGNTARNGGGIGQNSTGDITVTGGIVTGNTATNNGGGIWFGGGGGTSLSVSGGTISDNTAAEKGGGVYVNSSTFAMEGGSITGNEAKNGGGVYVNGGSFDMEGGTVSGNNAPTDPEIGSKSSASLPRFPIEVDPNIRDGSVTADKTEACVGEVVTLTVTPENGYVLRSLTVTDSAGNSVAVTNDRFTMPGRGVSVTAEFAERCEYYIEYPDGSMSGYVSRTGSDSFENTAYPGETVTLTADPYSSTGSSIGITASFTVLAYHDEYPAGYTDEVPGVSRPDPNTLTFPMPAANVKIFVEFADMGTNQNLVFIRDMEGGTVEADKMIADDGDTVTLSIRPDNGYEYIPSTLQILEINENLTDYEDLTEVEYRFTEISENSEYQVELDTWDVYVYAQFRKAPEQTKYAVLVDDDIENGRLSADLAQAEKGWKVRVKAEPETHLAYALENLAVMDQSGSPIATTALGGGSEYQYEFTMPEKDVFITGTFAIPVRGITAVTLTEPENAATNSYIIVSEESEVGFSVDITTVLMPEDELKELTVKGDVSGDAISVTTGSHNEGSSVYHSSFIMPSEPVTVTVRFGKKIHTIFADESMSGTLSLEINGEVKSVPVKAAADDKIVLIYTPPELRTLRSLKYQFMHNGSLRNVYLKFTRLENGSYTAQFDMRGADVTILAEISDGPEVPYVNPDGSHAGEAACTFVSAGDEIWSTGWYAVDGTITNDSRISVDGSVNLILLDGATLTVPKGISVNSGSSFTVWGQTAGTGMLDALRKDRDDNSAGIGGDDGFDSGVITINGGTVKACGHSRRAGTGGGAGIGGGNNGSGTVIINGGSVMARTAGWAAAIGGGSKGTGTVEINGGSVDAFSASEGAGIGGGYGGIGIVVIRGGKVTAKGGSYGAGIGGGSDFNGNLSPSLITINGGTVNASGDYAYGAAGIGGGNRGCATVVIGGGKIVADGGQYGAGIGNGKGRSGSDITLNWTNPADSVYADSYGGSVTLQKAFRSENGSVIYPAGSIDGSALQGVTLKPCDAPAFMTMSLVLSGQIGVNFYMSLPEIEGVDYTDSVMEFSVPHGTCTENDTRDEDCMSVDGRYYGFTCYINAIQMAEPITAVFHYTQDGVEKTVTATHSAADYFEVFDKMTDQYDLTTRNLIKAVADYGHYVQPFLAELRGWTLGTDYDEMDGHYTEAANFDMEAIAAEAADHKVVNNNNTGGDITAVTYSLTLDSETAINVYFKPAPAFNGTVAATVDGIDAAVDVTDSGAYCVRIANIAAHKLSESHEIVLTTGEGRTVKVTVSALSYVDTMLNYYTDETNEYHVKARNAAAAIYAYSCAADAYEAARSGS
ncbi:MAG: hypothetical protein IKQ92_02240 [Clostridia bacterium]|nr:hypothetical protein [Clostridia bacterium]